MTTNVNFEHSAAGNAFARVARLPTIAVDLVTAPFHAHVPDSFPWLADPARSAGRFTSLSRAGVLRSSSAVVRDCASILVEGHELGMVDLGEWLFDRRIFDLVRFADEWTPEDLADDIGEDDKLLSRLRDLLSLCRAPSEQPCTTGWEVSPTTSLTLATTRATVTAAEDRNRYIDFEHLTVPDYEKAIVFCARTGAESQRPIRPPARSPRAGAFRFFTGRAA